MTNSNNKQILLAGGTGLIGRELTAALVNQGYNVVILSRSPYGKRRRFPHRVSAIEWDGVFTTWLVREVEKSYAIINLAGEGIANKPWTLRRRMQLIRSRLGITRSLAKACHYAKRKPEVFIQGSAIGYYPFSDNEIFNEQSPPGDGFLSRLTSDWESVAKVEIPEEIRLVIVRTGVVLSSKGGMFPKLVKPVKFFVGSWFGSGKQFVSWVHIRDEVNAIIYLMHSESDNGAYNVVAPYPISQKQLVKKIAKRLTRPAWLSIPALPLKWILGQMADELLLNGSKVEPTRLNESGYEFTYPDIEMALDDLL
jgi:uncharacterized protein (TIGR01777 family)